MCLAIPAKVIEINGKEALVDYGELKQKIRLDLLEDVKVGDYVLVHVGYAIQKLDEREAEETLRILAELAEIEE
ncbi:MAG: hydrogenase expression/formation protein HypC [Archaeoglobi archaeon]|nr:HypC/HybG/HupF family hydrogenase formation chaperone [Candidatus Mnemosynella bozhongmuii]MDI3502548.1 hydrogenase expression/formation protein HypC [Archaeoglobi archaeon]MDK2781982.1 hydrogenase expression/formation protein HypC [Archaeoglobi archaeon]